MLSDLPRKFSKKDLMKVFAGGFFVLFIIACIVVSAESSEVHEGEGTAQSAPKRHFPSAAFREPEMSGMMMVASEPSARSEVRRAAPVQRDIGKAVVNAANDAIEGNDDFMSLKGGSMLVRDARVNIRTKSENVEPLANQVVEKFEALNGYVAQRSSRGKASDFTMSTELTLKVPSESYSTALKAIRGLVKEEEITLLSEFVEDVTGQYIDVKARERSLESTFNQLSELMKRADTVDQVLKVQRELAWITQQLESKKAQRTHLEKSSSFSTFNLGISTGNRPSQPPPKGKHKGKHKGHWSARKSFQRAFKFLARAAQKLTDILIFTIVLGIVPLSVLGVLFMCLWRCRSQRKLPLSSE